MGNNDAFRDFEELVIGLYDIGKLDIEVLDVLGRCYWPNDWLGIHWLVGLSTRNGQSAAQVVIAMIRGAEYKSASPYDSEFDVFWELTNARWRS